MTDQPTAVLAAAEGAGAEIAWVVIYILCWFFVIFPFVLWYFGVRTPRAEREARRAGADAGTGAPIAAVTQRDDDRTAVAG